MIVTILACITIAIAIAVSLGALRHDFRTIRLEKMAKKHPYAGWRIKRPAVTIYIIGGTKHDQQKSIASLSKVRYKNIHYKIMKTMIVSPKNQYTILLPAGDLLTRSTLIECVRYMNFSGTHLYSRPMEPMASILTTSFLLRSFRAHWQYIPTIALNGFLPIHRRIAAGLDVLRVTVRISITTVVLYATYTAIVASQPELLLLLIVGGIAYCVIATVSDSRVSIKRRLAMVALLPASMLYGYLLMATIGVLTITEIILQARAAIKSVHGYVSN